MEKEISIIEKLASSLKRRDEVPNQELAQEIVLSKNKKAIKELVENLSSKKTIQNDCIKVLYEIGMQEPRMIADYVHEFVKQLNTKNNRLQWGIMIALNTISKERPEEIYDVLPHILNVADKGSVITKDHAVNILIKLSSVEGYADNAFTLLIEQLLKSPENQLPAYPEKTIPVVNGKNKKLFVKTLNTRLADIEVDTKRKRIERVIKKIGQ
ncbi:hypothetical protein [Ulvibacterium marinum]|uniref:HEAT repeat domain-containing protein n=1 Tax=Ulvibacterium marinum TaxID=2419782 RepID=A0A3B0C5K9_9FLAO|nr:hypothetical protein [Ulvibacterium marinum]RKN79414.1 hypothetical protein D7Z94_13960 [Ulvibacterium marinum]